VVRLSGALHIDCTHCQPSLLTVPAGVYGTSLLVRTLIMPTLVPTYRTPTTAGTFFRFAFCFALTSLRLMSAHGAQ
jgi:hypothetical protein